MPEPITTRARLLLAASATGFLIALLALPLLGSARADREAVHTLSNRELVFASAVQEMRTLALELELDAAHALLVRPDEPAIRANNSRRALLADEIRRARVHAGTVASVDVVDDFANTVLRLNAATDRIVASHGTASPNAGAEVAGDLAVEGAHLNELGEELTTLAVTATEHRVQSIAGTSRNDGIVLLLLASGALTLYAASLAWIECGPALRHAIAGIYSSVRIPSWRRTTPSSPGGTADDGADVVTYPHPAGTDPDSIPPVSPGEREPFDAQSIVLNLRENPSGELQQPDAA